MTGSVLPSQQNTERRPERTVSDLSPQERAYLVAARRMDETGLRITRTPSGEAFVARVRAL